MKILLLNPHVDAGHKILKSFQAQNHALLLPENAAEAWQMAKLHGQSVQLAIIHREGLSHQDADAGTKLIDQLKMDPIQADLPVILSSESWTEADFAKHQQTPSGANAYLRWPYSETDLAETIRAIFGEATPEDSSVSMPSALTEGSLQLAGYTSASTNGGPPELPAENASEAVVLQDAGGMFSTDSGSNSSSISLEAPWTDDPEPAAPPALASFESSGALLEIGSDSAPAALSTLEVQASRPAHTPRFSQSGSAMLLQPMPFGDAVVPGGAAQSPDVETLKKYLLLREQDVATLSAQLRSTREQLTVFSSQLEQEREKNTELSAAAEDHKRALEDARRAGEAERNSLRKEIEDLRFEIKTKMDKARLLESQVREATQEMDRLKERVRSDIRKIRVREKELENRLEIARSDSDVLVNSREAKIVELKRKLDLLEFNMDLLQDRFARERENSLKLRERLVKAAQVVRVAGGVLDSPAESDNANANQDEGKQEAS